MPELPEVETTLRGLHPVCTGKRITQVKINTPKLRWPIDKALEYSLKQQEIVDMKRRAKYLIFEFKTGALISHLGMSGHFKITANDAPWRKHDHFGLLIEDKWIRLNDPRRFGAILWAQDWHAHPLIQSLGPEPLSASFNANTLFEQCQRRNSAIKTVIMNAHIVVGVGNIYACESLFMANIHPARPAKKLTKNDSQNLVAAIKKILKQAIASGGTTLKDFSHGEGQLGYFQQKLKVYGKENQTCPHCQGLIEKCNINQRSSFFCPNCQSI
jgi:formamidopyrimidine-DNA glycosylase